MGFDSTDKLDNVVDLAKFKEAAKTTAATEQDNDASWDFWESEFWIVRDRPPYRV